MTTNIPSKQTSYINNPPHPMMHHYSAEFNSPTQQNLNSQNQQHSHQQPFLIPNGNINGVNNNNNLNQHPNHFHSPILNPVYSPEMYFQSLQFQQNSAEILRDPYNSSPLQNNMAQNSGLILHNGNNNNNFETHFTHKPNQLHMLPANSPLHQSTHAQNNQQHSPTLLPSPNNFNFQSPISMDGESFNGNNFIHVSDTMSQDSSGMQFYPPYCQSDDNMFTSQDGSFFDMKQMNVTVIPMEAHKQPYMYSINVRDGQTCLKNVFSDQYPHNYWQQIFHEHSPQLPPSYSVFRRNFCDTYQHFKGMCVHILILKCPGFKFPRNPNAHTLQLFCATHFYGPLVVALNQISNPHRLCQFVPQHLNFIQQLNKKDEKQYPPPYVPSTVPTRSQRFYSASTIISNGSLTNNVDMMNSSMNKNINHIISPSLSAYSAMATRSPTPFMVPEPFSLGPNNYPNQMKKMTFGDQVKLEQDQMGGLNTQLYPSKDLLNRSMDDMYRNQRESQQQQYIPPNNNKMMLNQSFSNAQHQQSMFDDFSGSQITKEDREQFQLFQASRTPEQFYMYRYKTIFCPQNKKKHDWASCIFAHRMQDFRRKPDRFQYNPQPCPRQNLETGTGCTNGVRCKYSHSMFQKLYHPLSYKTQPCDQSYKSKRKKCKRGDMCAFFHEAGEKRLLPGKQYNIERNMYSSTHQWNGNNGGIFSSSSSSSSQIRSPIKQEQHKKFIEMMRNQNNNFYHNIQPQQNPQYIIPNSQNNHGMSSQQVPIHKYLINSPQKNINFSPYGPNILSNQSSMYNNHSPEQPHNILSNSFTSPSVSQPFTQSAKKVDGGEQEEEEMIKQIQKMQIINQNPQQLIIKNEQRENCPKFRSSPIPYSQISEQQTVSKNQQQYTVNEITDLLTAINLQNDQQNLNQQIDEKVNRPIEQIKDENDSPSLNQEIKKQFDQNLIKQDEEKNISEIQYEEENSGQFIMTIQENQTQNQFDNISITLTDRLIESHPASRIFTPVNNSPTCGTPHQEGPSINFFYTPNNRTPNQSPSLASGSSKIKNRLIQQDIFSDFGSSVRLSSENNRFKRNKQSSQHNTTKETLAARQNRTTNASSLKSQVQSQIVLKKRFVGSLPKQLQQKQNLMMEQNNLKHSKDPKAQEEGKDILENIQNKEKEEDGREEEQEEEEDEQSDADKSFISITKDGFQRFKRLNQSHRQFQDALSTSQNNIDGEDDNEDDEQENQKQLFQRKQTSENDIMKELAKNLHQKIRFEQNISTLKQSPFSSKNGLGLPFFADYSMSGNGEGNHQVFHLEDKERQNSSNYSSIMKNILVHTESGQSSQFLTTHISSGSNAPPEYQPLPLYPIQQNYDLLESALREMGHDRHFSTLKKHAVGYKQFILHSEEQLLNLGLPKYVIQNLKEKINSTQPIVSSPKAGNMISLSQQHINDVEISSNGIVEQKQYLPIIVEKEYIEKENN